jgi:tripartite-type tricarboxylate transporter receptor subunit TctC
MVGTQIHTAERRISADDRTAHETQRLCNGRGGLCRCRGAFAIAFTNFPARPVTLTVPWPAGAPPMSACGARGRIAHLRQPIVVENRSGGSGTLGPGQMAATAKPDGYTIAQIPITVFRFPS